MEHVHVVCRPQQPNKLLHGGSLLGGLRARSLGLVAGMACGPCSVAHMCVVRLSGARTHAIRCGKSRDCGGKGLANMLRLWGDSGFAQLGAGILSFRMSRGSRIGCNLVV